MDTAGFGSKSSTDVDPRHLVGPIVDRVNGGEEGARTPDLSDANAALSQLSYFPEEATSNPGLSRTSTNRVAPYRARLHRGRGHVRPRETR